MEAEEDTSNWNTLEDVDSMRRDRFLRDFNSINSATTSTATATTTITSRLTDLSAERTTARELHCTTPRSATVSFELCPLFLFQKRSVALLCRRTTLKFHNTFMTWSPTRAPTNRLNCKVEKRKTKRIERDGRCPITGHPEKLEWKMRGASDT